MELVGLRGQLKPGAADGYKAAHDAIPGDVLRAQRAAGIRRWFIFRHDLELFHFAECEDFAGAVAQLALDPFDRRWQGVVGDFKVPVNIAGDTETRMELVYARDLWAPGQD